jgi:hypothetical protein
MTILRLASVLSPLIPIIAGRKNRSSFLWWYALASLLTELATFLIKSYLDPNNSIAGNLFEIAEYSLLLLYFRNKVSLRDTLFYSLLVCGLTFFILTTSFDKGWFRLNRVGISTLVVVYIALSITGFYTMLKQKKIVFLEKSSFFWANVAILIYSSGSFFLFLSTSHITNSADKAALTQLWGTLFVSLNILKNILLGIALSKKETT